MFAGNKAISQMGPGMRGHFNALPAKEMTRKTMMIVVVMVTMVTMVMTLMMVMMVMMVRTIMNESPSRLN